MEGELTRKKIDISGAGLKEEKKPKENEEEIEEEEEVEEEEEIESEKIKFSETKKPEEEEEYEVNFNSEEDISKFTSGKTKESQNIKEKGFENQTIEDIEKEISDAEKKANEIDPETFYDVADFIITLVDGSIASGLKWWTKDSSDSAYSLPKPKKDKLTKQLAKILIKYNAKFSIELMFIIGLIIMYIPAFRLARSRKKEIEAMNIKVIPVKQVVPENPNIQTETANIVQDEVNSEVLEVVKPKVRPNRRPRKA